MREKCHLKIFFNINAYEAGFCGTGNKHTCFLIKKKKSPNRTQDGSGIKFSTQINYNCFLLLSVNGINVP